MRVLLLSLTLIFVAAVENVRAQDWMSRPSYFSRESGPTGLPSENLPLSRSAYRRAYIGLSPGVAVRGGWRYNTIYLQSGNSTDVTIQREGMFELVP